ncbi:IS1-like element transposase [Chlorogloea sp. CCALA 695]|uniref:IS1-like element transposase n=1 Tax=Chlorogloea sp. CCALA 695 TaxID=2107693 RepID=UPI0018EC69BA|nr:IS1-like element transposase [Chlorogloea sp. CCALA 695]
MAKLLKESNATNALEKPCSGRTFLSDYSYSGQSRKVKEQIVDMALNGSGIGDTARVLHISNSTVIKELKKRNRNCNK